MTSWDLVGELGHAEGPPVAFNWTAQGLVSPLLPWLAILALLALKPNRGWSAWWAWLPLSLLAAAWHFVELKITGLPRDVITLVLDVPRALAFGIAALWLWAPYIAGGSRHGRIVRIVRMVWVIAGFGILSLACAGGWDAGAAARMRGLPGGGYPCAAAWAGGTPETLLLAALSLVIAAAVILSGLLCSRRFLPRLYLRFAVCLTATLFAAIALGYACVLVRPPSGVEPLSFLGIGVLISVLGLVDLLPFLVLSAANTLSRERLRSLVHPQVQPHPQKHVPRPVPDVPVVTRDGPDGGRQQPSARA